jgi:hypothetical protein
VSVTRNWARNDASKTFRSLVRQGSSVERDAVQVVGGGAISSLATAVAVLRQTRDSAVHAALAAAETATLLVPGLMRPSLIAKPSPRKSTAAKSNRARKARTTHPDRRVKRATKRARRVS